MCLRAIVTSPLLLYTEAVRYLHGCRALLRDAVQNKEDDGSGV
jgi:hypothetical protein